MPNEFERQVQQKMEELKLTPSAPVWEKVEMQIRQRRERRRFFFWLPLLAILLGGLTWFALRTGQSTAVNIASNKPNAEPGTTNGFQKDQPASTVHTYPANTNRKTTSPTSPSLNAHKKNEVPTVVSNEHPIRTTPVVRKGATASVKISEGKRSASNSSRESTRSRIDKPRVEKTTTANGNNSTHKPSKQPDGNIVKQKQSDTATGVKPPERTIEPSPTKEEDKKKDTTASKPSAPKKAAASKWKFAVAFGGGVSGADNGLNLFAADKMMASPQNTPGTFYSFSSYDNSVNKGLSLLVGLDAVRKLNERFSLITGLEYNYYSYSMIVGRKKDSAASVGVTNSFYSAMDSVRNTYRNHFHSLSIPVAISWKVSRKIPLQIDAGLELQRILQTNALVLDAAGYNYVRDKDAIRKTQLFSHLGISYSFAVKKNALAIGPQLQYGLSALDKTNGGKHVFNIGLKAQLALKKNL